MANAQLSALSPLTPALSLSLPPSLSVTLVKWPENLHVQLAAASSVNYLCLLHKMQKLPRHQPRPPFHLFQMQLSPSYYISWLVGESEENGQQMHREFLLNFLTNSNANSYAKEIHYN